MRKLPGSIYRAKGVVYLTDAPQRRAVLQVVGRRVDISLQEEWTARRTLRSSPLARRAASTRICWKRASAPACRRRPAERAAEGQARVERS